MASHPHPHFNDLRITLSRYPLLSVSGHLFHQILLTLETLFYVSKIKILICYIRPSDKDHVSSKYRVFQT